MELPRDAKLVEGVIVIECRMAIQKEAADRLMEMANAAWPDHKVVILQDGLRIGSSPEQLNRIEAKLDKVLANMVRRPPSGFGPG